MPDDEVATQAAWIDEAVAEARTPFPGRRSFVCPHCDVFAQQQDLGTIYGSASNSWQRIDNWFATRCVSCQQVALYYGTALRSPNGLAGFPAPDDMPAAALEFYNEARLVANISPRSAAALLRLCLEQLVNELQPGSDKLNDKIGKLGAKGLDDRVVQAMDVVRGFGNAAGAHVGEIDLKDDPATVQALFRMLLIIVDEVIRRPKDIAEMFSRLSPGALAAIAARDAKAKAK